MQQLEDSMNTFLKQHGNDAIESIEIACTQSSKLRETEFIGVGMITYIPSPPGGSKKKAKNRNTPAKAKR